MTEFVNSLTWLSDPVPLPFCPEENAPNFTGYSAYVNELKNWGRDGAGADDDDDWIGVTYDNAQVVNVVCEATPADGETMNVRRIAFKTGAWHHNKQFQSAVWRTKVDGRLVTVSIFKSMARCEGTLTPQHALDTFQLVFQRLFELGELRSPCPHNFQCKNLVASTSVPSNIDRGGVMKQNPSIVTFSEAIYPAATARMYSNTQERQPLSDLVHSRSKSTKNRDTISSVYKSLQRRRTIRKKRRKRKNRATISVYGPGSLVVCGAKSKLDIIGVMAPYARIIKRQAVYPYDTDPLPSS